MPQVRCGTMHIKHLTPHIVHNRPTLGLADRQIDSHHGPYPRNTSGPDWMYWKVKGTRRTKREDSPRTRRRWGRSCSRRRHLYERSISVLTLRSPLPPPTHLPTPDLHVLSLDEGLVSPPRNRVQSDVLDTAVRHHLRPSPISRACPHRLLLIPLRRETSVDDMVPIVGINRFSRLRTLGQSPIILHVHLYYGNHRHHPMRKWR